METKAPYDIIHGATPSVGHFLVFGCKAFVHVPAQKQERKFSARAIEGIIVEYCERDACRTLLSDKSTVVDTNDVPSD